MVKAPSLIWYHDFDDPTSLVVHQGTALLKQSMRDLLRGSSAYVMVMLMFLVASPLLVQCRHHGFANVGGTARSLTNTSDKPGTVLRYCRAACPSCNPQCPP